MMLPKIDASTFENVTSEFFRAELPLLYLKEKTNQLNEHDHNLLESIVTLSEKIFVDNDDASDHDKGVNKARAIALALVVVNLINTQMEIDWLKA